MNKPIDRYAICLAWDALAAKGQYDEACEDLQNLSQQVTRQDRQIADHGQ